MRRYSYLIVLTLLTCYLYSQDITDYLFNNVVIVKEEIEWGSKVINRIRKFNFDIDLNIVELEIIEEDTNEFLQLGFNITPDNEIYVFYLDDKDYPIYIFYYDESWQIMADSMADFSIIDIENKIEQ